MARKGDINFILHPRVDGTDHYASLKIITCIPQNPIISGQKVDTDDSGRPESHEKSERSLILEI